MKIFLLDFDKTIMNTTEFIKIMREFWRTNLSPETNARLNEYVAEFDRGEHKTFRAYDHVSGQEWLLAQQYLRECIPKLLYADALDFIEHVNNPKQIALAILTFGHRKFQEAKVVASRLNLPAICTENGNKTDVIREWWNGDAYVIDGKKYRELVLVDDKIHNFDGFENLPQASGYLIVREGRKDVPDLPANVTTISSFDEIVL
jgi:hypothetical protein